ncbi:MAG TPA: Ig-like domain repeat protein [Candidatus Sulfotelmatobacter sp.]|nr:Ig-like domain repeat protein [Candidatus Sulfotelmatobacter sp.]
MRAITSSSSNFSRFFFVSVSTFLTAVFWSAVVCTPAFGQEAAQAGAGSPQPLITQAVDEMQLTTLQGNVHPLARAEFDLGTAPASLPMERMLLVLKRSPAQESALTRLLDDQQDKASPNYHKWLTPEEYGKQFGPTDGDMQTITSWLQSHGFQVGSTQGRAVLEFSGSASQVEEAFHTAIHKYIVNGEQHWANASDPAIPTALAAAVAGIDSLHDFRRKAMSHLAGKYSAETKVLAEAEPNFTFACGGGQACYGVVPYDFATIYDVLPLWNNGIDGTGQSIAIVGRTDINPNDATTFWQLFGLTVPQNKLNIIVNGADPGTTGDEGEANIDVQWSGAVAPQATIDFVTSKSTQTTDGVDLSALYIVENNLAPVMSESYGQCELGLGTAGNQFFRTLWEQAAAQGISVFVSSGDNGSAGCDDPGGPAKFGLNVNGIASTPFNAAVGGTDFNQYKKWTSYWNSTNSASTQQSAKGYIPETTWNDSCTNALAVTLGYGSTAEQACNNPQMISAGGVNSVGGSGGPSNCVVNSQQVGSCTQGYAKPSWQAGTGVPTDNLRDLPDISLFASNGFMSSFYVICQQDQTGICNLNNFLGYGGTSVSSPAFAGIMALVDQKMGTPQGVPGFALYKLAGKQANAFHDVPSGSTIGMPCITGTPNCVTKTSADTYGILSGYSTTAAYDLATGLGSVDAANLVNNWSKATFSATTATLQLNNGAAVNVVHGTPVAVNIGVNPGAATGDATLLVDSGAGTTSGQTFGLFELSGGSASGNTSLLPGGNYNVKAHYVGDGTYGGSYSSPVSVTVSKESSQPVIFLETFDSGGGVINGHTTTAIYGSPYALRVNINNAAGQLCAPGLGFSSIACPTGDVTITNNGTALDTGSFTLNNSGYFEDSMVQLPTGSNSVKAAYAGDNSFAASTTTSTISITRATSFLNAPNVTSAAVGAAMIATAQVQSLSTGLPPTGTVTFYSNGTPIAGTTTYQGGNQVGPPAVAWTNVNFTSSTSAFTTPGNYSITASYSGDANYAPVTSSDTGISIMYPNPTISFAPSTLNVDPGGTATLTALVDTTNKTVHPSGTLNFVNAQNFSVLAGPLTCTSTKDSSGNYACQATASFTVNSAITAEVQYLGDTNYPATDAGFAQIAMNDFNIAIDSSSIVTVPQGQSQTARIDIAALGNFNGTVTNFSCSGLPAEATCAFSPAQVTGQGSTTLTVSAMPVGQSRRAAFGGRGIGWIANVMLLLVGACALATPARRRRSVLLMVVVVGLFVSVPGCGGGGGSGSTTPPPNNPVPAITTLSPSQQAAGSVGQTLTINGSGFMSSSAVKFNGVAHAPAFANSSQMSISLSASDLANLGRYPVVVTNPTPGGGPSGSVNFDVVTGTPTGSSNVTVTATSGSLTHTTTFTLVVQ